MASEIGSKSFSDMLWTDGGEDGGVDGEDVRWKCASLDGSALTGLVDPELIPMSRY